MPLHTISFSVANGVFTYHSDGHPHGNSVHVNGRDTVRWFCGEGAFAIVFPGSSPFKDSSFAGKKNDNTTPATVDQPLGTYKYSVLVGIDGQTYHDDPDIIVDSTARKKPSSGAAYAKGAKGKPAAAKKPKPRKSSAKARK